MYCTALYCTELRCTVLNYTVLYDITQHCTVLCYITLYCTALHNTVLYCTILLWTGLHYAALYCTTLHYTARSGELVLLSDACQIFCNLLKMFASPQNFCFTVLHKGKETVLGAQRAPQALQRS